MATVTGIETTRNSINVDVNGFTQITANLFTSDGTYDSAGIGCLIEDKTIAKLYGSVGVKGRNKKIFSIKGLKDGTVRAKIYSKSNPEIYTYVTIVVGNGVNVIFVDSISVTPSEITIKKGWKSALSVLIIKSDNTQYSSSSLATWKSSDSYIASVSNNGVVTGVFPGVAIITVRSIEDTTKFCTCTVNVLESDESELPDDDEQQEIIIDPYGDDEDDSPTPGGETTSKGTDYIYRIEYDGSAFTSHRLYRGNLGFSTYNPIESITYFESDDVQKIYWIDRNHPLRFMNFMADDEERSRFDDTYFDCNRAVKFDVGVEISKSNSGNSRPNGVIQYLITYFNKHGQESGYVWVSDLVYLSPVGVGGTADGTNNNSVTLFISNLDDRFTHYRVYSLFRSSINGQAVGYIVSEGEIQKDKSVVVVDDGAHLTSIDADKLLFLGSKPVVAGTMTHKDQTLFLGDLQSIGRGQSIDALEKTIRSKMIRWDEPYKGMTNGCISFVYSTGDEGFENIPLNDFESDVYVYESQLSKSSSQIKTFKGGEKYRFALTFCYEDGTHTEAFWIGDAINDKYPIETPDGVQRAIAKCNIPSDVVEAIKNCRFKTARLMIAEATYADRSVKAQGIVNPTVFNVWERYNNRLYAMPSWISRPRNSGFAWRHFEPIHNSISTTGEIQCNYWTDTLRTPHPYYIVRDYDIPSISRINENFDGIPQYTDCKIVYRIRHAAGEIGNNWYGEVRVIWLQRSENTAASTHQFTENEINENKRIEDSSCLIQICEKNGFYATVGFTVTVSEHAAELLYPKIVEVLSSNYSIPPGAIVELPTYQSWVGKVYNQFLDDDKYFAVGASSDGYSNASGAVNAISWSPISELVSINDYNHQASYYKKHLTFIDENTITLNSPEIEYNAVNFDNVDSDSYRFRIVGVFKITGQYNDLVVNAVPGKLPGENLSNNDFTKDSLDGLTARPLWREQNLTERTYEESDPSASYSIVSDITKRTSYDYVWGSGVVKYWMYMWNRSGKISAYTDYDNDEYSLLNTKTFANLWYSGRTVYNNYRSYNVVYNPYSIRIFNQVSSQYVGIKKNGELKSYDGYINTSISMPSSHKYPVIYSSSDSAQNNSNLTFETYLYQSDPIQMTYMSSPHAVISFESVYLPTSNLYKETVLPVMFDSERIPREDMTHLSGGRNTGWLIPWIKNKTSGTYEYIDYSFDYPIFSLDDSSALSDGDRYLYVGEIYYDYSNSEDTRYGGVTDAAIKNNRFVNAGPHYLVDDMDIEGTDMYANEGDTYFQRWDCLKTKPISTDAKNNVIDITSVMLETHINIDGVTDKQRGTKYIASIDTAEFGKLNPVYSQPNNYFVQRDLDEDANLDTYRSSITWTLPKQDMGITDEWTHITLASSLALDGDKGICHALRRFQNSIISFQDRGISEILFNSRTQLSTTDGVPVEIANSGKVDGKRYITNKYGCTNKWSIVEGKNALYFVDNINKAFCGFSGNGIDPLSSRLGFSVWFKDMNRLNEWNPENFDNIVSFYDKVNADVYLVKGSDDDMPCLVYNENLNTFTSFFDYGNVPMMTNVQDRFVSYKNEKLWLQNEGLYCNFFGNQYDYWTQYRVTPDPFSDKIWTNVDYRADFYDILDDDGASVVPEEYLINGDDYGVKDDLYKEHETFSSYKVWNEYQTTGDVSTKTNTSEIDPARKKFRIWRINIPRALTKEDPSRRTLDRIRNPWINILFKKEDADNKQLMQLHDFVVKYFE